MAVCTVANELLKFKTRILPIHVGALQILKGFLMSDFPSLLQSGAQNMYNPSWDLNLRINFPMISLRFHEHLKKDNCSYTYLYRNALP